MSLIISSASAQQQEPQEKQRPKIGLVLSGGGAKGLAHVGVLKVLEEVGIRPDYITGVSMGSIVGGLYSIGYSAHQLDSLAMVTDWIAAFSDEVSFDKVGINMKEDFRKYQLNFSGNNFKSVKLPLGLVRGQLIFELLSGMCWRANGVESFDHFPIPFRCLAADIISGKTYTFSSGSLAQAMRASMAIPTAFTPIVKDSLLLVDGGIINNFPVQECIDMGADIVIGVYVGSQENIEAKDLNSMIKILMHSATLFGLKNAAESMGAVDIKIVPNINEYGVESFGKAKEIVDLGEAMARSETVFNQLLDLKKKLDSFPSNEKKEPVFSEHEIPINKIQIKGLKYAGRDFVIAMSGIKEKSTVSKDELSLAMKVLYSTLVFEKIENYFVKEGNAFNLVFEVIEKDRIQANASVFYDNFFDAGLLLNLSYKHLGIKTSKVDIALNISKFPQVILAYHLYGGENKRLFFTLSANAHSIIIPNYYEFPSSVVVSLGQFKNNQLQLSASVGHSITQNSKIELKSTFSSNYFYLQNGLENLYGVERVIATNFSVEAAYHINTFNHPIFPTKGLRLDMEYRKILNPKSSFQDDNGMFEVISNENEIAVIDFKQYIRFAPSFSLVPEFTLAYMSSIPFYADKFFLGGSGFNSRRNTFNQAGVQPYQIATDNFLKLGLGFQLKMIKNLYVSGFWESAFFINHAETYSEESLRLNGETISGWVGSVAYNSVIGPVKFAISQNTDNHKYYYYFSFGFPF
jgi:NTE family protein